jgi:hypothetical protein
MALMSKNKPTKRVNFDGGFVEIQFLSKGVKAEYQNRMAALLKDLGSIDINELKKAKEDDDIPQDMNVDEVLKKVNEAEYFKLSKAIKSWSEDEEITDLTVQELDDEVFDKISNKIDEMNELSEGEEKN